MNEPEQRSLGSFVSYAGMFTVWRREMVAAVQYWPSIFGGLMTPVLLYLVFGLVVGDLMPSFDELPYHQFIVPAVVTLQVAMGTYFQASYSTYYARNFTMTLEELLTSPLLAGDILLGRALGGMTVGLATSFPLLFVLSAVSGIAFSLRGLALSALLLALTGLFFSMLGSAVGLIAHNEFLLINASNLVIMPLVFLSDTFFPLSLYSAWLEKIIRFSPVTLIVSEMRRVLFARPPEPLAYLGLLAYVAVMLGVTAILFRREIAGA